MSKKSIKINEKTYNYDFTKVNFRQITILEDEYDLNLMEMDKKPMSTLLSLFAYVANLDLDQAGEEVDKHIEKGGSFEDLTTLLVDFQDCAFFQSLGKKVK